MIKRCPNEIREEYLPLGHALKFVILSSKLRNVDEVQYFNNLKAISKKVKNVEKARHIGEAGAIPILIYGNGLFDYTLGEAEGNYEVWNSNDRYDVLNIYEMRTKFTKEQLITFSDKKKMDIVKGRAVDFHLSGDRLTQLCANDIQSFDSKNLSFYTRTGIKICLQDVDYIEIINF